MDAISTARLRAALAKRGLRAPGAALALERALARAKGAQIGGRRIFDAFLPPWPGPGFDRFIDGALGLEPVVPLAIVDADGEAGRAAARRAAELRPCALGLSGDLLWQEADPFVALVEALSPTCALWAIGSGRRSTASVMYRLANAGLIGAAIGFYSADAPAQDAVWGRKSWDDAVTAVGLSAQAGILPAMLVEARAELFEADGLRDLHRLSSEIGAAFLVLAVSDRTLGAPALAFAAARNEHPAFADYPGIAVLGPGLAGGHLAASFFDLPAPRPPPSLALEPEPERELTGMDLPEPPPSYARHTPPSRIKGGVIDALLKRRSK